MDRKNYIQGLILGTAAFTIWGLLPLYWKLVNVITPYQLFAQRVVWSLIFVFLILFIKKDLVLFGKLISNKRNWPNIIGPATTISINWLLYIWAVNNNFVLEASLGYYINPLVLTLIGCVFLKERMNKLEVMGIVFAFMGVLVKSVTYGRVPIIALVLAVSFALYGTMKKKSPLKSLYGLGFETLVISIPCSIYLLLAESSGLGISGNLPKYYWFIISLSGIATATPLILYAESTKKLPLNVVGFLQYIAPTIMLILGIFVFKEPFDIASGVSFGFIWIGLIFFSYSQFKFLKHYQAINLPSNSPLYQSTEDRSNLE